MERRHVDHARPGAGGAGKAFNRLALSRLGLIEVEVSSDPVRFLTIMSENL
ncbi:hypothetical protein DLJ82_4436 [Rhizobium leguminosarum]|uniref:Uncharacterized protein n=1 Tax=Rhizobium leguminosarum TaxID=384 RepID=A0A2Z4YLR9_RHILE|nr:hypothetical protein DLJ82_4436 [Rhizobium leguminosarum]